MRVEQVLIALAILNLTVLIADVVFNALSGLVSLF
jgi:hypothetical protein